MRLPAVLQVNPPELRASFRYNDTLECLKICQAFNLSDCVIKSQQKYKHHTPWPAFKNPVHEDSLSKVKIKKIDPSEDSCPVKNTCKDGRLTLPNPLKKLKVSKMKYDMY